MKQFICLQKVPELWIGTNYLIQIGTRLRTGIVQTDNAADGGDCRTNLIIEIDYLRKTLKYTRCFIEEQLIYINECYNILAQGQRGMSQLYLLLYITDELTIISYVYPLDLSITQATLTIFKKMKMEGKA